MNYSDATAGADATLNVGEATANDIDMREYYARTFLAFRGPAAGFGLKPEKAAEAFARSGIQPTRFPDEKAIRERIRQMALADHSGEFFDRSKQVMAAWDGRDPNRDPGAPNDPEEIPYNDPRWQSTKWQMENQDKVVAHAKAKIAGFNRERAARRGY